MIYAPVAFMFSRPRSMSSNLFIASSRGLSAANLDALR